MGWTCTRIPSYYPTRMDYLDRNCCTWDNAASAASVLKSTIVGSVYYAAIEKIDKASGNRIVFAAIILTKFHPKAEDGLTFCYKDMDETVGPCEVDCPASILDLLTPTESEYAQAWRKECREARKSKAKAKSMMPKPGDKIRLAEPMKFTDGKDLTDFEVVTFMRKGRQRTLYKSLENGSIYRISRIADQKFVHLFTAKAA